MPLSRRVLVPLDCSNLAERILGQVHRLLVRHDLEVVLFHVVDPRAGQGSEAAAGAYLDRLSAELQRKGAPARAEIARGDPAEEIVAAAERLDVSLVAMSTHGRGGLLRLMRGTVAERVLRSCTRPLFIANPAALDRSGPEARFGRILVPLDGSEFAGGIVPLVEDFARRYESEVLLLRIEWAFAAMVGPYAPDVAGLRPLAEVAKELEPVRARLEAAGVRARVITCYGPEATEILDTAEREHVDLVALSTHGRSGLSRWAYGSVTEHVVRHCARPLLVRRVAEG